YQAEVTFLFKFYFIIISSLLILIISIKKTFLFKFYFIIISSLLILIISIKKTNTQKQSCLSLGRKIRFFLKSSII
ncbi:hypothetical protein DW714_05735, partial [Streptococcus anginosus]